MYVSIADESRRVTRDGSRAGGLRPVEESLRMCFRVGFDASLDPSIFWHVLPEPVSFDPLSSGHRTQVGSVEAGAPSTSTDVDAASGAVPSRPGSGTDGLVWRSAGELAALIASGAVSASDVVDAHIRRIEEVDVRLNAVVSR